MYISAIIPAYNEEELLGYCLESVIKQTTTTPYEIIVVDNNSDDNTSKVAHKYDARLVSEPKQGTAAARNTGSAVSQGEALIFVDADVILPKNHFQKITNKLTSHPEIDVLAGPYVYYDGGIHARWGTEKLDYYTHYFQLVKLTTGVQGFSGGNVAIRKKVFKEIGGFDESITDINGGEDLALAIQLNKEHKNIYWDKQLKGKTSYRRYQGSEIMDRLQRFKYSIKCLMKKRIHT